MADASCTTMLRRPIGLLCLATFALVLFATSISIVVPLLGPFATVVFTIITLFAILGGILAFIIRNGDANLASAAKTRF
jgi:hypothetical protein